MTHHILQYALAEVLKAHWKSSSTRVSPCRSSEEILDTRDRLSIPTKLFPISKVSVWWRDEDWRKRKSNLRETDSSTSLPNFKTDVIYPHDRLYNLKRSNTWCLITGLFQQFCGEHVRGLLCPNLSHDIWTTPYHPCPSHMVFLQKAWAWACTQYQMSTALALWFCTEVSNINSASPSTFTRNKWRA